jgi:DNA-binding transcriptional MocR family regulator
VEIEIDRASALPVYQQIIQRIRESIVSGALPAGFKLPPERRLASALGVNRSTVLAAYRELKADGLLDAHVGRGTTVVGQPANLSSSGPIQSVPWRQLFCPVPSAAQDPLVRDLLALADRADAINLSVGLPSPDLFPIDELRKLTDELLTEVGPRLLQHSPTEGHTALRDTLAQWMAARGIRCSPAEVLVVSGSQQALDLAGRVFVEPGDTVIVEEPSFFGALQAFRNARARLVGVPTDDKGMRTDVLAGILERHRPKLIYTLPTFQNPSGAVLSLERRKQLLALAYRYQVPILEDDPYSELRYDGEPLPSLRSLDEHGYVIYVSTFSKMLFPGFRLGWVVAPRPVVHQLTIAKQAIDLHSTSIGQWLIDSFLRRGLLTPHLANVRRGYAERRDVLDEGLRKHGPSGLEWHKPEGGFYIWCRLPVGVERSRLLAAAAEAGVAYLPGASCFVNEPLADHIRLNFSFALPDEIAEGTVRLGRALRRAASRGGSSQHEETGTPPIV